MAALAMPGIAPMAAAMIGTKAPRKPPFRFLRLRAALLCLRVRLLRLFEGEETAKRRRRRFGQSIWRGKIPEPNCFYFTSLQIEARRRAPSSTATSNDHRRGGDSGWRGNRNDNSCRARRARAVLSLLCSSSRRIGCVVALLLSCDSTFVEAFVFPVPFTDLGRALPTI